MIQHIVGATFDLIRSVESIYMRLVFLAPVVNFVIFSIVVVRLLEYMSLCKKLAKEIEKFDSQLYFQRYCDPIFKSPMNTLALFNDIRYPEDIPEGIKDRFGGDFAIVRKVLYSVIWWFCGGIFIFT